MAKLLKPWLMVLVGVIVGVVGAAGLLLERWQAVPTEAAVLAPAAAPGAMRPAGRSSAVRSTGISVSVQLVDQFKLPIVNASIEVICRRPCSSPPRLGTRQGRYRLLVRQPDPVVAARVTAPGCQDYRFLLVDEFTRRPPTFLQRQLTCRRDLELTTISPVYGARVIDHRAGSVERGSCLGAPGSHFAGGNAHVYCLRDVAPDDLVTLTWSGDGYRPWTERFQISRTDVLLGHRSTIRPVPDIRFLALAIRGNRDGRALHASIRLDGSASMPGMIGGQELAVDRFGRALVRIDEALSGERFTLAVLPHDGFAAVPNRLDPRISRLAAPDQPLRLSFRRADLPASPPGLPWIELTVSPHP